MSTFENKVYCNEFLSEKIKILRKNSIINRKKYSIEELGKPVTYWIKKERLIKEIGKEFTVILRTKGCSWALGAEGGCSMCGYVQDANIEDVKPELLIDQFNFALNDKLEEIENDKNNFVLKIFNSGSFFDENEISQNTRKFIYEKIEQIKNVKEFVVESRAEYITAEKLVEMKDIIKNKYIEIGIGLETVNDYFRNNYINKGLKWNDFLKVTNLCKEYDIGIKAYLLFKPPFFNEIAAIDDCINSIQILSKLKINTISINPLNIQKGSLVENLWFQNRYRPPWFYSLFECLKKSLNQEMLNHLRILSSPSGAGSERGIHNCKKKECNVTMINNLKEFVLTQDLYELNKKESECDCEIKYLLARNYL
jgi:radical SAM enzyme (TIGR01210 family)